MNIIIKKPLISEKSMGLSKTGWYTFLVARNARKTEIAQAVEEQFSVDVLAVRTVNIKPEVKMQRARRRYVNTSVIKKAIVRVKDGQKIKLFEPEKVSEEAALENKEEVKVKKSLLKGTKVKIEKGEKSK